MTLPPVENPETSPGVSLWRQPPLWLAVTVVAVSIVVMALLRLALFPHKVVPIGYGVPLILFVWLRRSSYA